MSQTLWFTSVSRYNLIRCEVTVQPPRVTPLTPTGPKTNSNTMVQTQKKQLIVCDPFSSLTSALTRSSSSWSELESTGDFFKKHWCVCEQKKSGGGFVWIRFQPSQQFNPSGPVCVCLCVCSRGYIQNTLWPLRSHTEVGVLSVWKVVWKNHWVF